MSKIAKGIGKGLKKVGEGLKKAVKGVGKVFKKVVTSKIFWVVVAVALIAYSAGAFTPAVTSATPAATQATAVASTTTATAGAAGAGAGAGAGAAAGAGTAASSTLAPITVAPQALAGGGMSAGVAPAAATGAGAGASAAAGTAAPAAAGTVAPAAAPITTATPAYIAPTVTTKASGGVIGALKGGLGSVASWIGDNPWPVALGMQAGGAALQANAATDMAEDERKRREGNYNIQDMSPAFNLAPSAKPNVSEQVDVGQQTIASTQVNAPRRAESAKTGRSPRRDNDRNRRALIDSKMKAGLNNEMNEDKSKGVA